MAFARVESLEQRALFAVLAPDLSFGQEGGITGPARNGLVRNVPQHWLTNVTESGVLATVMLRTSGTNRFVVQRFTAAGTLDPSFKAIPLSDDAAWLKTGVAQDAQGRVLVVRTPQGDTEITVTRYTASGDLDTSYGTNGVARVVLPTFEGERSSYPVIEAIRTTADGSAYVAFEHYTFVGQATSRQRRWLAKLDANGKFNAGFGGGDGFVRVGGREPAQGSPLGRTEYEESRFFLLVDPQGRAIVGNRINFGTFTIRRLLANGDPDTGFGTNGTFTANPGQNLTFHLRVDAQGRPLLAASGQASLLYRLNTAGQLDTTFSGDGIVDDLLTAQTEEIRAILPQADGKVLLQVLGNGHWVTRLNANGTVDTTYDGDGRREVVDELGYTQFRAITPAGKLIGNVEHQDYIHSITQFTTPAPVEVAPATGVLYVRGTNAADVVTITHLSGGGTRVVLNGTTSDFTGVNAIDATLEGGNNKFEAGTLAIPVSITSGDGNDTIVTGNGEDRVDTRGGTDAITTNSGRDEIFFGAGDKTVDSGYGGGYVWTTRIADDAPLSNVTVRGTGHRDGPDSWSVILQKAKADVRLGGTRADVNAYADADQLIDLSAMTRGAIEGRATVRTGLGDDSILTGAGDDFIESRAGNDTIRTGAGNDFVYADYELNYPAPTTIAPGTADDVIELGAGNDRVADAYGNNTISGGDGDDRISTGNGRDSIAGGVGRDLIRAGGNNDTIDGGGSVDRLFGQAGNDRILGGNNSDLLVGGTGADTLIGGWGSDLLVAGDPNAPRVAGVINILDGVRDTDSAQRESDDDVLTSIESIVTTVT